MLNVVRESRGKRVLTEILGEGFEGLLSVMGGGLTESITGRIQWF